MSAALCQVPEDVACDLPAEVNVEIRIPTIAVVGLTRYYTAKTFPLCRDHADAVQQHRTDCGGCPVCPSVRVAFHAIEGGAS